MSSYLLLALQYVLQGTLYGLQVRYLPIILRKTGSSLFLVGSLNLLTFPWLVKSLWAPIIDAYGDKNTWLSLNYAGIAVSLSLANTGETSESSRSFASSKNPHFQNEAKWTTFLVRNSCIYMRIKNRITYSRFDTEARRNSKKACF